jgi:uncharacterized BrkB/YihY/UPF0761 family membrane protein
MAKVASNNRKRPGLTRRMTRGTLRLGMLATAVVVGRKTAGGRDGGDGDGQPARTGQEGGGQGLAGAAGGESAPAQETGPRAVTDDGRGRAADVPQEIPPRGWLDIAKRTAKEVKADQVPLLAAGVAFYALLSLFPAIIAAVSIYGLVADPTTVQDQIANLTKLLSPETADLVGQQLIQVTSGAGRALGLATMIGILTALWSASSGMKALITGVNLAYDETETRKFVKLRGLALLLTLGAMVLATVGFSLYANFFGNYNKTYGALAGVIILMFWLFLSAFVVLVGAELNTEMELQTAKDTTAGPTRPMGDRDAHAADHVAESR